VYNSRRAAVTAPLAGGAAAGRQRPLAARGAMLESSARPDIMTHAPSSHDATASFIRRRLQECFAPIHLELADESARHAGHKGAAAGGGHFAVVIVAASFEGMSLLARHRAIYDALRGEMGGAVHALAIDALAPSEWRHPTAP